MNTDRIDDVAASWKSIAESLKAGEASNPRSKRALVSGVGTLDDIVGGFFGGDLVLIAARPDMGNDSLALQVANHAARDDAVVAVLSPKQDAGEVARRILAMDASVPIHALQVGSLNDLERIAAKEALRVARGRRLLIDDTPRLSTRSVRAKLSALRDEFRKVDLVVVDQFHMLDADRFDHSISRVEENSEVSRSLKAIAREFECPVLVVCHIPRSPLEQRPDKRPVLADLRHLGTAETDADLILFVYRDELYDASTAAPGIAEIIVGRQRNGPLGTALADFNAATGMLSAAPQRGD